MALVMDHVVKDSEMEKDGEYEEYELEEACKILAKAEEIKADAQLMKALKPLLEKKVKAHLSLQDLEKLAGKKRLEEKGIK